MAPKSTVLYPSRIPAWTIKSPHVWLESLGCQIVDLKNLRKKLSESFGPTDPLNNQKICKGLSVFWQIEKVSTWVHQVVGGIRILPMWRHVEPLLQGMLDACHRESKGKMDLLRFAEWNLTPPASNKPHTSPSLPCFGSLVCLPLVYNIIRTQGPSHESSQAGWWAPSRFTFVWGPLYMKVFFIGTTLKSEVGHPTICWTWLEHQIWTYWK